MASTERLDPQAIADALRVWDISNWISWERLEDRRKDKALEKHQMRDQLWEGDNSPETQLIHKEMLKGLSDDAKDVVRLIFDTPNDLFDLVVTPAAKRMTKKSLITFLRKHWGWSYPTIHSVFAEIKEVAHILK